jgi:branched-chain amino acid transport system permease protein
MSEAAVKRLLLALGLALVIVFPLLDSNRYHINLVILIALYGINAMALDIVLGVAGQISLCQSVFYGMGAYVSGILNVKLGLDFWLCLPTAIILSALLALLIGLTALRFKGHFLAMVTLAIVLIFIELVREWYDLTGGPDGFPGIGRPAIGSFVFNTETRYYYLVMVFTLILIYFGHFVVRGRTGRALAAIRQNETVSLAFGISPSSQKLKAFVLSGVFGGVAGSLYAHYSSFIGSEDFSLHVSITFLCMTVVGGLRTGVWGGMLGAALLTLLPEALNALVRLHVLPGFLKFVVQDYAYILMLYGVIVLLVVLYLPHGMVGLLRQGGRRLWDVTTGQKRTVGEQT